jgi:hypothetical protein
MSIAELDLKALRVRYLNLIVNEPIHEEEGQ